MLIFTEKIDPVPHQLLGGKSADRRHQLLDKTQSQCKMVIVPTRPHPSPTLHFLGEERRGDDDGEGPQTHVVLCTVRWNLGPEPAKIEQDVPVGQRHFVEQRIGLVAVAHGRDVLEEGGGDEPVVHEGDGGQQQRRELRRVLQRADELVVALRVRKRGRAAPPSCAASAWRA